MCKSDKRETVLLRVYEGVVGVCVCGGGGSSV